MTSKTEQLIREELLSPHTSVGLLLNSILAFPHAEETAGSMKKRLVKELMPWFLSKLFEVEKEAREEGYFELEKLLFADYKRDLKTNEGKDANGYAHAIALAKQVLLTKLKQ